MDSNPVAIFFFVSLFQNFSSYPDHRHVMPKEERRGRKEGYREKRVEVERENERKGRRERVRGGGRERRGRRRETDRKTDRRNPQPTPDLFWQTEPRASETNDGRSALAVQVLPPNLKMAGFLALFMPFRSGYA